jgi:predicted dehydrogenase
MSKLRWGVLSTAKIGLNKVIPAIQTSRLGEAVAICSRDLASAQTAADELGIAKAYGSYEALLADPDIDAIYNPLPNHLHVPWSLKALEAGKHVLCEKPLGMNAADIQPLLEAAAARPGLKVMEAFMYRFHPQWRKTMELVKQGDFGQFRHVHSHFSYNNREPDNIRNHRAMGGGALLDIGCYSISLSRLLYQSEPLRVLGKITPYAGYEVDCFVSAILEFAEGTASFTVSTKVEGNQFVEASGEAGGLRLSIPFSPQNDAVTRLELKKSGETEIIELAPSDQYRDMTDAFAQSVFEQTPVPTPLSDALANMRVIDAVFTSAAKNEWVEVTR